MKKFQELGFNRALFSAGQRVCCALSGGADSTAMLLAVVEANQEKESLGIVLSGLHINHGLRGSEADEDENFVRDLCDRLQVPCRIFRVDTPGRQEAEREGVEEAARQLRYACFRQVLSEGVTDVVATAHTSDDQAETVIMKLMRGAWTDGLGGISPVIYKSAAKGSGTAGSRPIGGTIREPEIVRPLLGVRRTEIEAFLREHEQPWRVDSTNADTTLTRNRVRHELMPLLRSFNPAIDELLVNTATIARDEEQHWEAELHRWLPQIVLPGKPVRGGGRAVSTAVGEKSVSLELERLKPMDNALRRRIVRGAARSLGVRLSFDDTAKILALAGFGGHERVKGLAGSRLELRSGFRAERSPRELRLWTQTNP